MSDPDEYAAFLEAEVAKTKTGHCPNCNAALRPLHCCVCEGCDGCREHAASPSDAEQLMELRRVGKAEQDVAVKCLCGEKMSKVAIPRTGYDYRWVCEQADKRNYPLHVPVPKPLPERTRAQKIVAAQEYSALAAVNDELAQLRNVDYVPTDLINRQREATQQALESVAVAALIADTERLSALRSAAPVALKWMDWWLDSELCECDSAVHVCGKTERRKEADALRAALNPSQAKER